MATIPRPRKPRYVVRDSAGRALRETDSKLAAWSVWFRNRRDGATAHGRLSWIEDEKSWLRCGDLPPEKRANGERKIGMTEYHYTCLNCGNRTRVFIHGEEHDGKSDMVACDQCGDDVTVNLAKAN